MTVKGRLCGVIPTIDPSVRTDSAFDLLTSSIKSSLNVRQRRCGSTPEIARRSLSFSLVFIATILFVGHVRALSPFLSKLIRGLS